LADNAKDQERRAARKLKNGNDLNPTPQLENMDGPASPAPLVSQARAQGEDLPIEER
jgi:hypothetical protein